MTPKEQRKFELAALTRSPDGMDKIIELYMERCLPRFQMPPAGMLTNQMIVAILDKEFPNG